MRTVIAVLTELPLLAMCMECLEVATTLRVSMVAIELDRLGTKVRVDPARCEQCHVFGPVFGMAA